jgi:hypothetical protein
MIMLARAGLAPTSLGRRGDPRLRQLSLKSEELKHPGIGDCSVN